MKKFLSILISAVIAASAWSCQDEIDVDKALNFPPAIMPETPTNQGQVVIGNFDVKIIFLDGAKSPLKSARLIMTDSQGNQIFSVSEDLQGTKDSVIVAGTTFDAQSLGEGQYYLHVDALDTHDQLTTMEIEFVITTSPYPANNDAMYIAGDFNGWGSDEMTLVAANTWEIKSVDLKGGKWKFKNTTDWSDTDWGDADCDGVMAETTGGGPDTDCKYSGVVDIRFNDQTLAYTITPSVSYAKRVNDLYLLGNMNQFQGSEYKFNLVADNRWELAEIRLKPGDVFKFSEGPNFNGRNFGDANLDGKAEEFGPNIIRADDAEDAFYKIIFNDRSLTYELELLRYPFPSNLYLVGNSSSAGWDTGTSIPFVKTGDGQFEIYAYLSSGEEDGFKFLEVQDWAGDWGKGEEGKLVQEGESNLQVPSDGFYRITVDFNTMSYNVTAVSWGFVGNGTTGDDSGWNTDVNLEFIGGKGSYTWRKTVTLYNGEVKFRANGSWDINLGGNGGNGSLRYGGDNIAVTAGTYVVELVLDPVNGYSYSITPN